MQKIKSTSINIEGDLYEQNKKIINTNDVLKQKKVIIKLTENIDASERPKIIALQDYNNAFLLGKLLTSYFDIPIGVLPGQNNLLNQSKTIITHGAVIDRGLIGGSINQNVFANTNGELSFDYSNVKLGRLINIDPATVYVNIGEQRSYDLTFSKDFQFLENENKSLETALQKIMLFLNKVTA